MREDKELEATSQTAQLPRVAKYKGTKRSLSHVALPSKLQRPAFSALGHCKEFVHPQWQSQGLHAVGGHSLGRIAVEIDLHEMTFRLEAVPFQQTKYIQTTSKQLVCVQEFQPW